MEEKIKIAFDPIGIWDRDDFRKLIKSLYECEEYEISIVSVSFDIDFLTSVKNDIGENISISMTSNYDSLIEVLEKGEIQIYLSSDQKIILFVDAMSTVTVGILVNNIMDTYRTQLKYITKLNFWINYIKKGDSLGKSCE